MGEKKAYWARDGNKRRGKRKRKGDEMKIKRVIWGLVVPLLLLTAAIPANAKGEVVSQDFDSSKTGSITIYKYVANDYVAVDNKGLPLNQSGYDQTEAVRNATGNQTMLPEKGVSFGYLKIADFTAMSSGTSTEPYFTNVNSDFISMITQTYGISLTSVSLKDDAGKTGTYYKTDEFTSAMGTLVNAPANGKTSMTGADSVRSLISKSGKTFGTTDEYGGTKVSDLPVGLYLVGEINWEKQGIAKYDDRWERVDLSGVRDGADNPSYADIVQPSQPFLVQLPITNLDTIDSEGQTYQPGTVWQYDVTAFPKNQSSLIHKDIINNDHDGDTVSNGSDTDKSETGCDYVLTSSSKSGLTHQRDVSVGDTVQQVVTSSVPATRASNGSLIDKYAVSDRMTKGLQVLKIDSVKFGPYAWDDSSNNTVSPDYYTISIAPDRLSWKVEFKNVDKLFTNTKQQYVYITFTSLVTKDALIGTDTYSYTTEDSSQISATNQNTAKLTYSSKATSEQSFYSNTPKVYTYEIDLAKTVTNADQASVKDVAFYMQNAKGEEINVTKVSDGVYTPYISTMLSSSGAISQVNPSEDANSKANHTNSAMSPAADGSLKILGLDSGDYIFHEFRTAKGQNLPTEPFTVRLVGHMAVDEQGIKYENGSLEHAYCWSGNEPSDLRNYDLLATQADKLKTGRAEVKIINESGISILRTGGKGTVLFYVCGGLLIVAGVVYLVIRSGKKKEEGEEKDEKESQ